MSALSADHEAFMGLPGFDAFVRPEDVRQASCREPRLLLLDEHANSHTAAVALTAVARWPPCSFLDSELRGEQACQATGVYLYSAVMARYICSVSPEVAFCCPWRVASRSLPFSAACDFLTEAVADHGGRDRWIGRTAIPRPLFVPSPTPQGCEMGVRVFSGLGCRSGTKDCKVAKRQNPK
jgi:hypothetical protein